MLDVNIVKLTGMYRQTDRHTGTHIESCWHISAGGRIRLDWMVRWLGLRLISVQQDLNLIEDVSHIGVYCVR